MVSGLIVAFYYKPSIAYESVQKLTYLVPYGDMFRELHYFSSEAFLLFTLLHVILELLKSKLHLSSYSWNYSIVALVILFIFMFTGYVLKADLSGLSAGEVALSMLQQTPFLEYFLPLLQDNALFVWKFYIWHILFLPVGFIYVLLFHIKSLKTKYLIVGLGLSVLGMMIFDMPKDISPLLTNVHVTGPWFFRGAENLLLLGVEPIFVILTLAIPFTLLFVYFYKEQYRRLLRYLLSAWCVVYALLYLV
jgi:ubiquinol-cytochrome c reductase cytochrome b subunit